MSNSNYGIENIKHLDTRTAFRTRIQVHLGSDDTNGMYQAVKEIVNNATDEFWAGYGDKVIITINEEKNSINVQDFGRGVPFGEKDGQNVLVAIYTQEYTGGKYDKNAYKNSSGLNGLGGKAVCLSSEYFTVTSTRDGKQAIANFYQGELKSYEEHNVSNLPSGTSVYFIPDKEVFLNAEKNISYEEVCIQIKRLSYQNKGLLFIVRNETTGEEQKYQANNGIADFIMDNIDKPLMKAPIIATATDGTDEIEIAFIYTGGTGASYVFVNGLYCPEGGAPVTGAKRTVTTAMKRLSGKDFDPELIRKGLVYAINCKVMNPSFEGQTKSKINNSNLSTLASQAFKEALEEFSNGPDFAPIIEMMVKYQKAEKAADKAREAILSQQKKMSELRKQKIAFIDKLSDAEDLGEDSILCVVEGDSAGNAAASGRDTKKYGVMRLRGKMINGLKEDDDKKYYENKEIELLLYALGIDPNNYNPKKLRYGKIAICVDADDDGYHIALLILANLYRLCPQFLRENRVYWLRSPLFIEQDKNGNPLSCYYTNEEFDKVRGKLKGYIKRVKGLGQLNEKDLKASMFSTTGEQRMDQIIYSEEGIEQLCQLMGVDIKPRKEFVFSRIDFSKYGAS